MMRYVVALLIAAFAIAWAGDVRKVDLTVTGMHCDRCVEKVKSALQKVTDVKDVAVSLKRGSAKVMLASTSATSSEMLAKAIADAGYSASYKEGKELRTLAATNKDMDCDEKDGDHAKMDCAKDEKSDCCAGMGAKTKVTKKK
jgi:copper chaperone CopZ